MSTNYIPYGYKTMPLEKRKELEFKIALILAPYIKEKGEEFRQSELEFLAIWVHHFDFKEVKVRDLFIKMFSHSMINYEILNHFINLGLVEKVRRGYYRLSHKFQDCYHTIQKHFPSPPQEQPCHDK